MMTVADYTELISSVSCPSTTSEEHCNEVGLREPAKRGRRIYIHQDSLNNIAATNTQAALLIFRTLARVVALKAFNHHIREDGVYLNLISKDVAEKLVSIVTERWSLLTSTALQNFEYVAERVNHRFLFSPVIQQDEQVIATCYFSNYYTFATGIEAARAMFADTNDISTVKAKKQASHEYDDLTLITGDTLRILGDNQMHSECDHDKRLTDEQLIALKIDVCREMLTSIDDLVRSSSYFLGNMEIELIHEVRGYIRNAFRKGVLKVPDEYDI